MARKYKTYIREEKAVEFTLTVPNLEEYKNAWLVINNNLRCYPRDLYQVRNNDGDDIYVMCNPDCADATREFLSQFGEIKRRDDDKIMVVVDVDCDYDDFDKDYVDSEIMIGEFN